MADFHCCQAWLQMCPKVTIVYCEFVFLWAVFIITPVTFLRHNSRFEVIMGEQHHENSMLALRIFTVLMVGEQESNLYQNLLFSRSMYNKPTIIKFHADLKK